MPLLDMRGEMRSDEQYRRHDLALSLFQETPSPRPTAGSKTHQILLSLGLRLLDCTRNFKLSFFSMIFLYSKVHFRDGYLRTVLCLKVEQFNHSAPLLRIGAIAEAP